jgi:hypothetical protein
MGGVTLPLKLMQQANPYPEVYSRTTKRMNLTLKTCAKTKTSQEVLVLTDPKCEKTIPKKKRLLRRLLKI